MDGHIASSRALAAIAYMCPAYIVVMGISSWYRHGGYRHSLVGPWAMGHKYAAFSASHLLSSVFDSVSARGK